MPGGSPERRVAVRPRVAWSMILPVLLAALLTALWMAPRAEARVGQDPAPEPTTEGSPPTDVPGEQVPAQTPVDPGVPSTSSPGDVPDATTTTVEVLAPTGTSPEQSESEKADRRVRLVVISLVVLAGVVAVVTVVFWRRTKPSRLASAEATAVVGHTGKP